MTLDEIMDMDPLLLTKNPGALDEIVSYHRKRRAERETQGAKRPKLDAGEKLVLGDLVKNMLNKTAAEPAAPTTVVKRRI